MTNTYVLIGMPGSGKSTLANYYKKGSRCCVLSSDEIRAEICGDATNQDHNKKVFDTLYNRMTCALRRGINPVIDATNINVKARKKIFEIGKQFDTVFVALNVITPIEKCKENNANRSRVVPNEVIDRMAQRYEKPTFEEGFDYIFEIDDRIIGSIIKRTNK